MIIADLRNRDNDLSSCRKFNGILNEIEEDLPQCRKNSKTAKQGKAVNRELRKNRSTHQKSRHHPRDAYVVADPSPIFIPFLK
jgi:hypothetical protein